MTQLRAQVDKILSGVSSAHVPKGFISEMFLPMIQSAQYSGKLAKYGNAHLRIENSLKGGKAKYRQVETITRSTSTFLVEGHGLTSLITKEDKRNYDDPYDAEKDETIGLTTSLFLEKEKTLADTVTSTSIMTLNTTLSGTAQFNDYSNSDPITKFRNGKVAIREACGAIADTAAMDWNVLEVLKYHPMLLDALGYKYAKPGGLGVEEIASALGLRKILVADVVYNSAKEGQSDNLDPVWGKHIVLGVLPEKAAPYQVSLGYRIQIAGSQPRKVYKETKFNPPDAVEILVEDEYDMFLSNVNAGYLIKDAIA